MPQVYDFENPYTLPQSAAATIPTELGQDFLSTLDRDLQLQERKQMEDLLGFQESRGLLRSGDTNRRLVEDVLGPGLERRKQALLPLALGGAEAGREERLGGTAFERQRQFASEEFSRQLQMAREQARLQQDLMRLQASLGNESYDYQQPGFGRQLLSGIAGGVGSGLAGGISKGVGAGIFQKFGGTVRGF